VDVQTRSVPITVYSLPSGAGPITGSNEVCSGQQGLSYSILPVEEATAYIWNYDGSGATLHGNSSSILIDFPENSTDGNLTVMGTNVCGNGPVSEAYPVVIQKLPPAAGIISGENTVCSGQQHVPYSVPAIPQATRYGWSYSGSGAVLSGNTNSIIVDFSENATSGNLTVAGQNSCGAGTRSADFFITVDPCNEKPVVNIPNSFSPNGDGINDYFVIRGLTENSTLIIFDRSGKKLVEFSNYQNDWDGKDQDGHSLESGTYWYVIFVSGIEEEFKGFVYLKR
jgi:gliding motility-associated-like protein